MATPEGQRRQRHSTATCDNTLLLSLRVSSFLLMQSGPHLHKKLVILYIRTLLYQLCCLFLCVCVCVMEREWQTSVHSAAFGFFWRESVNMCESVFDDHHHPVPVTAGVSRMNPCMCRSVRVQVGFGGSGVVASPCVLAEVTWDAVPELTALLTELVWIRLSQADPDGA